VYLAKIVQVATGEMNAILLKCVFCSLYFLDTFFHNLTLVDQDLVTAKTIA